MPHWARKVPLASNFLEGSNRLRASELLGKSQALFVQKHEIDPGDDLASLLERLGPLQKNP